MEILTEVNIRPDCVSEFVNVFSCVDGPVGDFEGGYNYKFNVKASI